MEGMEKVGMGVSALKGALDTQADMASRLINGGSAGHSAAKSGDDAALRTVAMQERGVGRSLDVNV